MITVSKFDGRNLENPPRIRCSGAGGGDRGGWQIGVAPVARDPQVLEFIGEP